MIRHIVIVLIMLSLGWASITARAQSGDLIPPEESVRAAELYHDSG